MAVRRAAGLALLFAAVGAHGLQEAEGERPVAKVVKILKDMKGTLEKEADSDQKLYDDMVCWCKTSEEAKTKAIADGIARDKKLTALIPELAATQAQLEVEISQLQKETAANEKALREATEIRAKELAAFREEETTGVQSITGLKNAIQAISSNHALNQEALIQVRQTIERHSQKRPQDVTSLKGKRLIASLLQERTSTSLRQHAPASGEIFGILKGMKESFETNLANSQQEEADGVAEFKQLKSAKEEEIAAATKLVESKTAGLAAAGEQRAKSKEDLEDTKTQVSADQKFLMDVQERCGTMDKEFADRTKLRGEEINGVNEALKILTDDDANDLFARSTFVQEDPVALLQVEAASARQAAQARALRVLRRSGRPVLMQLAASLHDDVFEKVKVIVDDLIVNLKKEQADEVAQKDMCIDDINTNEKEFAEKKSDHKDLATNLESINLSIEKLKDEIAAATEEVATTQQEILKASETREAENKEFQAIVVDQRATQEILNKALKKLQAVYKAAAASLLQVHAGTQRAGQAPPASFAPYKKSEGATGVVGMIENIIAESKEAEAKAVKDETEGQASYQAFVQDSRAAIDALHKTIRDRTKQSEKADADRLRDETDLKSLGEDMDAQDKFIHRLHGQCDFLIENFDQKQADRTAEMEALTEAKSLMHE